MTNYIHTKNNNARTNNYHTYVAVIICPSIIIINYISKPPSQY